MKIAEIAKILNAEFVCGQDLSDMEAKYACGCDMMSDVLAYVRESDGILLTGLANPQVVRTVAMMDMRCIIFVRGKKPDAKTVELAVHNSIALLTCPHNMFDACGLLYQNGIKGEER